MFANECYTMKVELTLVGLVYFLCGVGSQYCWIINVNFGEPVVDHTKHRFFTMSELVTNDFVFAAIRSCLLILITGWRNIFLSYTVD